MILIVDDDIAVRTIWHCCWKMQAIRCLLLKMRRCAEYRQPAGSKLIVLDLNFSIDTSGKEGMELLKNIRTIDSGVPVVHYYRMGQY